MDDVDAELARLALWTAFACAALAARIPPRNALLDQVTAARYADDLLADASARFPFLAPTPPDP